jgi:hypothetical protein
MSKQDGALVLQYRWQVVEVEGQPHLLYYGVRNPPCHHEVLIPVSPDLAQWLAKGALNANEQAPLQNEIHKLQEQGVLVDPAAKRQPATKETMRVCKRCVTNDYIIPGLEFNDEGVCALCQCYEQAQTPSRSAFATVTEDDLLKVKDNPESRFDVMVLYTGGKDSSYMLWLLARKLGLRVLAAFWNMPYCSDAAYQNIERAKRRMTEVEFVEWTLPLGKVHEAMRAKWRTHGWPCLCPTAAFPMLYPLAAHLRIPYVFLGLEDVQAAVLDYVAAPPGQSADSPPTLREQTLAFLAARALPREQIRPVHWRDEMSNYHAAVNEAMPDLFDDLAGLVQRARQDESVFMPLIARLKTNEAYGSWEDARRIIEEEMDWQAPADQNNLLHTSCVLEPVKDYLQFQRFRAMRTVFMPQSIVETGAAVFFGLTSREEGLAAVQELGYWQPPPVLDRLVRDLGITPDVVAESEDELRPGMAEWAGMET